MPRLLASLLLLLTSLLAGCSDDPATDLVRDYSARAANAIEVDFSLQLESAATFYTPLPERRLRLAPLTELSGGLLDMIELRRCRLVDLVAERNSSLGKLAGPSQRLIYELQFVPALRDCLAAIDTDPNLTELRGELSRVLEIKQNQLDAQLLNSLYASPEMEQQFSLGETPLAPQMAGEASQLRPTMEHFATLARLTQARQWQEPQFVSELEKGYEMLFRSQLGAQWLASMALLTQGLAQSAAAIETRLAGRPICFNQKPNNQSKILWNVFINYYVGRLQPYLARVEREGRAWSEHNLAILTPISAVPQTQIYRDYFDPQGAIWSDYLQARNRHTAAWQAILEQCGLRPGLPASG